MILLIGENRAEVSDLDVAALVRIASARDSSLKQSNHFLLAGLASSLFYSIKVSGLRIDLVFLDTQIFDVPYGLFVFGLIGSACFLLAQLRFLDAKALDFKLQRSAGSTSDLSVNYDSFPSEHNWLLPAQIEFGGDRGTKLQNFLLSCLGIITFAVYFAPLWASIHFLYYWPELAGSVYTEFQWWLILILLLVSLLSYALCQSIYAKREA